jgi:hypothetical protein
VFEATGGEPADAIDREDALAGFEGRLIVACGRGFLVNGIVVGMDSAEVLQAAFGESFQMLIQSASLGWQ